LWWSYIFILCCIYYATDQFHVPSLWVVTLVRSWGLRMA
jgi:hypothetical protein